MIGSDRWSTIATHISQVTGQFFSVQKHRSISGGSINQTCILSDGQQSYFVKLNQPSRLEMFISEKLGLEAIAHTRTLRVPQPICSGSTETDSYLVLEYLPLDCLRQTEAHRSNQNWAEMGRQLAQLHRCGGSESFGWQQNNTIGSTPQLNSQTPNWIDFFTQQRLGYQFQLARRRGGHFPREGELLGVIPRFLANHDPQPSLVHGDLWSGNAGFTDQGEPVIFDPAVYYGDREVDLAMTELFGGFPASFYQGYQHAWPLAAGYPQRKTLYNLYHILNHFNLFGGGYAAQANQMIEQILSCR